MMDSDARLAAPMVPGLPYVMAEAVFAVTYEMATTLDDILSRRTRALLFDRHATQQAARTVAEIVAPYTNWTTERIESEIVAFNEICEHEIVAGSITQSDLYS